MTPAAAPRKIPLTAFTCRANGRMFALTSDVDLFPASTYPDIPDKSLRCKALYDTGASHSAISPRAAAHLELASIGMTNVGVGGGTLTTSSHLVNIRLPNRVMFAMVRVAKMTLRPDIDALIGMDILGTGDFAVTNHQGKTTFSFCCPSQKEIDFVAEVRAGAKILPVRSDKVGRNSPCHCGSGKKYKKCCGKFA